MEIKVRKVNELYYLYKDEYLPYNIKLIFEDNTETEIDKELLERKPYILIGKKKPIKFTYEENIFITEKYINEKTKEEISVEEYEGRKKEVISKAQAVYEDGPYFEDIKAEMEYLKLKRFTPKDKIETVIREREIIELPPIYKAQPNPYMHLISIYPTEKDEELIYLYRRLDAIKDQIIKIAEKYKLKINKEEIKDKKGHSIKYLPFLEFWKREENIPETCHASLSLYKEDMMNIEQAIRKYVNRERNIVYIAKEILERYNFKDLLDLTYIRAGRRSDQEKIVKLREALSDIIELYNRLLEVER